MSQNFNILCTRNVLVSSGEDLHSGRIIKSFNLQNPDIQFWCWVLLSWRKTRDKINLSHTIHNRPRKEAMVRMIETEQCSLSTDVDVGATYFYLRYSKLFVFLSSTVWSIMKVSKIIANNSKNIWATKIFNTFFVSWILNIYDGVSYLSILLKRVSSTRVHNKNINFFANQILGKIFTQI